MQSDCIMQEKLVNMLGSVFFVLQLLDEGFVQLFISKNFLG